MEGMYIPSKCVIYCFVHVIGCDILLQLHISGSCDRASLTEEKKEPTDDTSKDVYSL